MELKDSKIYLLSLERRSDRRERFFAQNLPYKIDVFKAIDAKNVIYRGRLKKGQVACKLSHMEIIRDAIKNKHTFITIFEDDAQITFDFNERIDLLKNIPEDWDMVYLGAHHYMKPTPVSDGIGRCVTALSTVAYIINQRMYQTLLKELKRDMILDVIYTNIIQQSYNCYCIFPNIVTQVDGYSDIESIKVSYKKFYDKWL